MYPRGGGGGRMHVSLSLCGGQRIIYMTCKSPSTLLVPEIKLNSSESQTKSSCSPRCSSRWPWTPLTPPSVSSLHLTGVYYYNWDTSVFIPLPLFIRLRSHRFTSALSSPPDSFSLKAPETRNYTNRNQCCWSWPLSTAQNQKPTKPPSTLSQRLSELPNNPTPWPCLSFQHMPVECIIIAPHALSIVPSHTGWIYHNPTLLLVYPSVAC